MKKLSSIKMDLNFISYLFMIFPSLASIVFSNPAQPFNLGEYFQPYSTLNYTRGKRQLFREDIPHHRPLSGNIYANHHGFPHPGRWSDGLRSEHKPKPNVFPSHQQYIDMIDNDQHGHYYNRHKVPHHHSVSFGSNVLHGGGSGGGGGYDGPQFKPIFDHIGPSSDYGHGHNLQGPVSHQEQGGLDYDGPRPEYGPGPSKAPMHYRPPSQYKDHKRPKTFVHYHPVQYGNIVNFPDHNGGHNPNVNFNPAYGPKESYGPPNYSNGEPIGPSIQSGFLPSTGGFLDHSGGGGNGDHYNNHGSYHTNDIVGQTNHESYPNDHHKDSSPYQFEPFKIFSHPSPSPKSVDHELPIPIPILAQFHSAKPVKFQKIKHPVHIVYGHAPRRRPGPHYQHHPSRPYKSNWLHQFGL